MGRVSVRGSRRRRPLLALSVRDGVAIVGPLVPAAGGPCLRCLDLHRTDRDPAWPRLAAQLAEQDTEPVPCAAATILSAAGLAAAEILAYLDGGEPSTVGSTVEINGVGPWRRRSWAPHAACDCTRRR
jgi:bacteriocin biosynthesis cyclodehydratase domain-containing protein